MHWDIFQPRNVKWMAIALIGVVTAVNNPSMIPLYAICMTAIAFFEN